MPQHDYTIDNQTFPNTRSDINNALAAIATQNAGATAPATTYQYQPWADTTGKYLRLRNPANTAWMKFAGVSLNNLDGRIVAPSPVLCILSQNANLSLTMNSVTLVNWATEEYDPHNRFTSGVFNAPVTAWYEFNLTYRLVFNNTSNNQSIASLYNASAAEIYRFDTVMPTPVQDYSRSPSGLVPLNAGDQVSIRFFINSSTSTTCNLTGGTSRLVIRLHDLQ